MPSWAVVALVVVVASTVALAQLPAARATPDPPVRVGDIATVLPAADVDEIARVSACGSATPWLLIGSSGQAADVQFIEVFCAADTASLRVRRGPLAWVIRRAARRITLVPQVDSLSLSEQPQPTRHA
jgi:hypothetical protein